MKTADLTGALLDYWVARADGRDCQGEFLGLIKGRMPEARWFVRCRDADIKANPFYDFAPSSRWDQGGPIIEKEGIDLEYHNELSIGEQEVWWEAYYREGDACQCYTGSTPLVAAMRAYVDSKFGDSVPDDITD